MERNDEFRPRVPGDEISLHGLSPVSLIPKRYPAIAPPWGTLNCNRSQHRRIRLEDSAGRISRTWRPRGQKNTGSENYGGPVVTAGGVVFIGATNYDKKFRAFE